MTTIELKAKDLKAGHVLASGVKVISSPVAGLNTPKGKIEIGVEYPNGVRKLQVWNKETTLKRVA